MAVPSKGIRPTKQRRQRREIARCSRHARGGRGLFIGTIDRRFLSIRGSPLLSIETRFKISPVPRAVCVAPRPREPGSHVIMAEVAEKKRFEVKKVRTTRVR